MKLIRSNAKPAPLFNKDGEVNEKLPETIIKALGTPSEDIIRANEEEITRREKKIEELKASEKQLLKTKGSKLTPISKNNKTKFQDLKPKMNILRRE